MERLLREMNAPRLRPIWVGHVGLWPSRRFKIGWRVYRKRPKEWNPKTRYPDPVVVVSMGWVVATLGR